MKRKRRNKRRQSRTLIPAFDPAQLAKDIEQGGSRTTVAPPFDPSWYARIVEGHVSAGDGARDVPRTLAAAGGRAADRIPPGGSPATGAPTVPAPAARAMDDAVDVEVGERIGREMYGCYLASDFSEALALAERVLREQPDHPLAQLVAEKCRMRLEPSVPALSPSSVLRLRFAELERQTRHIDVKSSVVLGHVDGISDVATVAALTGLGAEALDRLHALVDLGVLEVVSG